MENLPDVVNCEDKMPECPKCGKKGLQINGKAQNGKRVRRFSSWLMLVDESWGPQFSTNLTYDVDGTFDELLRCTCGWGARLENVQFVHHNGSGL